MASPAKPLVIGSLRGRNGVDAPLSLPDDQCVSAVNVDWYRASFGRKRGGSDAISMTGHTGTDDINALFRHEPTGDSNDNELILVDANEDVSLLRNSASWTTITFSPAETIQGSSVQWEGVSFNGKWFVALDTAQDRLHVMDAGGTTIRRVGLATPAAPTVADTGSGSYDNQIRYYKVAYTVQSGGVTLRRSELSTSVSFTPSGSGTAARVTKPATISEGETHWELYGSPDDVEFYLLATTVVGTTTFDDDDDPDDYALNTLAPTAGVNTVPGSVKHLAVDDDRLVMAGSYETAALASTVFFTPVQGDLDVGDDERVPNTSTQNNRLTLDRGAGGEITGLGGPMNGFIYAFKYGRIYRLVRTGVVAAPYQPITISDQIGAITRRAICQGVDDVGAPALYFLSRRGPYRLSATYGLQYLGRDVEDRWSDVNLDATIDTAHAQYYEDKHQVWWWFATGTSTVPDRLLVFDVELGQTTAQGIVRGGWSEFDGAIADARCSVTFGATLGATMGRALVPYLGMLANVILRADTADEDDNGTAFQATVTTKPYAYAGLGALHRVEQVQVVGESEAGVVLQMTATSDFGRAAVTQHVTLTPNTDETRAMPRVAFDLTGNQVVAFTVGDPSALANAWRIDALVVKAAAEAVV